MDVWGVGKKIIIVTSGAILVASGVSAKDLPVLEILTKLNGNADKITSLQVTLQLSVKNIGAYGKTLDESGSVESLTISRSLQKMHRKTTTDEEVWDSGKKLRGRKIGNGWRNEPFQGTLEQSTPNALKNILFPEYLVGRMKVTSIVSHGHRVHLILVPPLANGSKSKTMRWEMDINMQKGIIEGLETYNDVGVKTESLWTNKWAKFGDAWIPGEVKIKRYGANNILTMHYSLRDIIINAPELDEGQ